MNTVRDFQVIERLRPQQGGVFSAADLQAALGERHPAAFARRVNRLLREGALARFCRGYYVASTFELPVLSQRLAPESCVSLETVLARELLIGPDPSRRLTAIKVGKGRRYTGLGFEIEHLGIAPDLLFGWEVRNGVRYADAEKAVLDVLYFHLRGRRSPFDLYSDLRLGKLDADRLQTYLRRYRNPRFTTFAQRLLNLE